MDNLWAPWRLPYIKLIKKKVKGCVFCRILKERRDRENFIVLRTRHSYLVLNIFPYNNGHLLVVPKRHVSDLGKLSKAERDDLLDLLERTQKLLDRALKPDGYNVGINLGRAAGAGFPGHLHIHVVPRWAGDVNFMPVLTNTKIISQSLKTLHRRLSDANQRRNRKA